MQTGQFPTALSGKEQQTLYNQWLASGNDHYRIKLVFSYVSLISSMISSSPLVVQDARDDILQEIVNKLYFHVKSYDPSRSAITTYFYRIIYTSLIDLIRRHNRNLKHETPLPDDEIIRISDSGTQSSGPESVEIYGTIFQNDENKILQEAIQRLPSKQRKIIKLRYLDGKTLAAIFKSVKVTRKVYRREHDRAMETLKSVLGGKLR